MTETVKFSQLRRVLAGLGFEESKQSDALTFTHADTDTVFLFQPYQANDLVAPVHVVMVRRILDERGLMERRAFEELLEKAPA